MKKIHASTVIVALFSLILSGVTSAGQNSNLANLQQGVIIAPCMYALLNGETEPQAYNIVMSQEGDSLTFSITSVELAKQGECDDYSAPTQQAGSLGLNADAIIPIGCEDINNSIAAEMKDAISDLDFSEENDFANGLIDSIMSEVTGKSLEQGSYICDEMN
jgi:hypothetical protein